ncbi:MAG: hypothetical protein K2P57_11705 [Burkholderiales bacterium]|nr:hypothetical protein [Burkholderiales bacterium]
MRFIHHQNRSGYAHCFVVGQINAFRWIYVMGHCDAMLLILLGRSQYESIQITLMSRTDFLNILCLTDFGKIICINLYRSVRLGTLAADTVKDFLDACTSKYLAHFASSVGDLPKEVALNVATYWNTRSILVAGNMFTSPPSTQDPIQYATILSVDAVTRNASSAKAATYSAWKVRNQPDFDVLIKEWLRGGAMWTFGLGKDYFWLARPVDFSSIHPARLAKGLAQYHLETLGLCHFGNKNSLVRALVPAALTVHVSPLLRPTALDGIDNPAFRAAADSEVAPPAAHPGSTIDLELVRSNAPTADGQHEWLGKPLAILATSVVWEFLGVPVDATCNEDSSFHAQVLQQFEKNTPLSSARNYLDAIS